MNEMTRRGALHTLAGAGLLSAIAHGADIEEVPSQGIKTERDCVLASGMTADEAVCWDLAADLAGKFLALPELHPMDKEEITLAVHVIQYRLLSRPTYPRY